MKDKNCYVYLHVDPINYEIFYVGISSKVSKNSYRRAYSIRDRNKFWRNKVNTLLDYQVIIIYNNISWEEACLKEIELISILGRRDIKTGTLVNLTNGGEGTIGRVFSSSHKEKLKQAFKKSTCRNTGKNFNNQKIVYQYCLITNNLIKIHENCTIAAKEIGCHSSSISSCARGKHFSCKGFKWFYNRL